MPTQATSAACGTCHTETYAEWQTSQHGEESLNCINCHNPHTTSLKAEDELALCNSCHNQETHFYAFTAHAAKGLTCTDCHLRVSDEPMGGGHGQRLHTFDVDLASCNQCHGGEMHYPVQDAMGGSEEIAEAVVPAAFEGQPEVERAEIAAEPAPQESNPFTHILAVVVGLGLGVIIAPALEGAYRRARSR
jgi:predicted CXXCH cytochrome family protein